MQAGPQIDDSLAGDDTKARPAVQSITGKTHIARSPQILAGQSQRPLPADHCVPTLACDVLEVGASTVNVLPLSPLCGERVGVMGDESAFSGLQRSARAGLAARCAR